MVLENVWGSTGPGLIDTGFNRAGYDMDGYYRGHQNGHGVFIGHDRYHVPAPRAIASGVNECGSGMVSGGQRASSGGNAAGTVRAETPAVMADEAKMGCR